MSFINGKRDSIIMGIMALVVLSMLIGIIILAWLNASANATTIATLGGFILITLYAFINYTKLESTAKEVSEVKAASVTTAKDLVVVKKDLVEVKHATNSLTHELVRVSEMKAHAEGKKEEKEEAATRTAEVSEVAKGVLAEAAAKARDVVAEAAKDAKP